MSSPSTSRRILVITALLLVAGGGVWWWMHRPAATVEEGARGTGAVAGGAAAAGGGTAAGGRERGRGGPASVGVVTIAPGELRITRNAIGTVTSLATVMVRAQIAGRLDQVLFQEGQLVKAGDLLAVIDARPYVLAQAQYQGQLLRDQAQLDGAARDLARYRTLVAQDSMARQQLDSQEALVQQLRGAIASDNAQIDMAKLNQAYCHMTAPVSGRLGMRLVDAGNYVTPGDANGLVTIAQLKPISVVFTLPETDLPLVRPHGGDGTAMAIAVFDRDGTTLLGTGALTAIDNAIDAATGTVKLRGSLANDDERVFPNQFVNVRIAIETRHVAAIVPVAAVQRNAQGTFVWSVKDGVASQRPIQTGITAGEQVEVLSGLAPGEVVVIDGVDRLRDGAPVLVGGGGEGAGGAAKPAGGGHRPRDGAGAGDGAGRERGEGKRRRDREGAGKPETDPAAPVPAGKPRASGNE